MTWNILFILKKLEKRASPDRRFRASLRARLVYVHGKPWYILMIKPVAGVLTVAVMMGAGTGVYAYSSDEVLPSHPLYQVRQQLESVEERLQFTDVQRAKLERKFLSRRVREAELMEVNHAPFKPHDVDRVMRAVQAAVAVGESLPPPKQRLHDHVVAQVELRHAKLMQRMRAQGPFDGRELVENAVEEKLEKIGAQIERLTEGRRQVYQNLLIRKAANMRRIPWRLENGVVHVLPPSNALRGYAPTSVRDFEALMQQAAVFQETAVPENAYPVRDSDGPILYQETTWIRPDAEETETIQAPDAVRIER